MTINAGGFDLLKNVDVTLSVELGQAQMKLKDVLALGTESVVGLDRLTDELLDVMVNGQVIAKAEILAQDGRFALRIVEMSEGEGAAAGVAGAAVGAGGGGGMGGGGGAGGGAGGGGDSS